MKLKTKINFIRKSIPYPKRLINATLSVMIISSPICFYNNLNAACNCKQADGTFKKLTFDYVVCNEYGVEVPSVGGGEYLIKLNKAYKIFLLINDKLKNPIDNNFWAEPLIFSATEDGTYKGSFSVDDTPYADFQTKGKCKLAVEFDYVIFDTQKILELTSKVKMSGASVRIEEYKY